MRLILSDISAHISPTSDTPALDASVLLAHILEKPRTWILAHPDLDLTAEQHNQLNKSLARLDNGEPLPYVLGHWEFFGLEFEITPDVLIPRPETELLVEKAIAWLKGSPDRRTVADIGTGSGIIAISIAVQVPGATILATDISPQALEVARKNAIKRSVEQCIEFVECDLFPQLFFPDPQPLSLWERGAEVRGFDLICANLPYIPTKTLHNLSVYGREPTLALDGGEDGLDLIRNLMELAPERLAPNGLMLLEIEASQGKQASNLAYDLFPDAMIRLHHDLTGHDRLLEIAL
ncbi:MAG TPA: peptide chain release factor N(5)-glutamine methyltransferase [Anaerolineales bacterium]|nr:peptide chain release factor N(5)-glutamine methyltransferase [Anaerolineales bacterium]